ncbi:hypothetical protein BST81_11695 [Leptolyngbya sp. 'hensonii']|nr:hypothetical protein BST81_11695 [Leptolyngbya sp. 'hensonii']
MSFSKLGLILDIVAASLLGLESWIKLRTIREDSITIGHGQVGAFWKLLFLLSWPLLVLGFVFQFMGSA